MATTFEPPPTYAEVVVFDERGEHPKFNPIWLKWFVDIAAYLTASGGGGVGVVHNNTTGLQGGTANEYYHFSNAFFTALTAGFTGAGNIVRQGSPTINTPTLTAPVLGTATGTKLTLATAAAVIATSVNLTNGAGAGAGTILNAPAAGNPTKWIGIDDNGTIRYVPAW